MEWVKTILNAVRVAVQNVETGCTRAIEALKARVTKLESASEKTVKNLNSLSSTVKSTNDTVKDISENAEEMSKELMNKIVEPSKDGGWYGFPGYVLAKTRTSQRWYPQKAIIPVTSWEEIQKVVRAGIADKLYRPGDQLVSYHSLFGRMIWDIIGFDIDTPVDTTYTHSMTLQSHFIIMPSLEYDVAEPTNPDSGIAEYGSSDWATSAVRQWLNSSKDAGAWWEAQTEYDVAPSHAASIPGFMLGLPEDFVKVLGKVNKSSRRNTGKTTSDYVTTQDTFFLLSVNEIYGGTSLGVSVYVGPEGKPYQFYSRYTDNAASKDKLSWRDANREKAWYEGTDQGYTWMLRSPYGISTREICEVGQSGNIGDKYVKYASGIAPACCIV